jgi:hypothetical protein
MNGSSVGYFTGRLKLTRTIIKFSQKKHANRRRSWEMDLQMNKKSPETLEQRLPEVPSNTFRRKLRD